MLVSSEDKELAREYEVKFFPSLGLFRNGDFVRYTGDLMDEFEVLEWLTARYGVSFILCLIFILNIVHKFDTILWTCSLYQHYSKACLKLKIKSLT